MWYVVSAFVLSLIAIFGYLIAYLLIYNNHRENNKLMLLLKYGFYIVLFIVFFCISFIVVYILVK